MNKFSPADVEQLQLRESYRGFFKILTYTLRHRLFAGGWSQPLRRELFERGHAAAALLYDPAHDLIGLIEQFRVGAMAAGINPWCFEVVAGMIDGDDSAESTIRRELIEEAQFIPDRLLKICSYLSSPGGTSERIELYCALGDLSSAAGIFGLDDEAEDIQLHVLPAETVFADLYNERYSNAATLIGLQWLQANRLSLIEEQ
ncbi:NUDIX domain-containing protein [Halioxenophilus sp. WMMB6]|uniref:NUDIX domain-containing protein n=1 Tax=Halioxenophilus sp. WMMB6 TaxID=3073815 RepID=UPI00295ECE5C|nr:NUDIX domain-containing protein [Halioxenophilus sp. WMMB6]